MGNDLLSPRGTPNVAVVNGTIETRPWAGGGVTIFLRGDDGNTYVYMHLLRIEGAVPRPVAQGELIGLVGNTGHSFGYHTHFEYHPGGGAAVSPYPLLSAACRGSRRTAATSGNVIHSGMSPPEASSARSSVPLTVRVSAPGGTSPAGT